MSENNKSYRIRTNVGEDKQVYIKLDQRFDILEIMSLKLRQENFYRLHKSEYGVIVGRVLANNGFGIPNAKVSVFVELSDDDAKRNDILAIYSFNSTRDKNDDDIRYNLLPDTPVNECHRAVGIFPSKTLMLDNDIVLEVFDKYYKYTTKTNESGDYMLFGVPTGNQTVHVDLDLSDIGILSQRPRDFVYKGYTIEQFENPNQFKHDTELQSLSQIFSQDSVVEVIPFWGDSNEGLIGISRNDVNINFKFEPTCVFMGSVVSDNNSNGFSKKCVPTNAMGNMDELVTGNGTVEMIRKKLDGTVEEFQVQGNQLINGDGIWCYQIPMNLDYMTTDEYGNMVPTDNPEKGIPTRTRVRFRVSLQDTEENKLNYFRGKFLVPNNPETQEELDYSFGSATLDSSYKDLFWNNVYTVKSYIPRIQKAKWFRTERFSGIKHCNIHGNNNPIPYNNIRIRLPFLFVIVCALIKAYVWIIKVVNNFLGVVPDIGIWPNYKDRVCIQVGESLCPDMEGWYFAPGCSTKWKHKLKINFEYGFCTGPYADLGFWDKVDHFFSFRVWINSVDYTMMGNTYEALVNDKGTSNDLSNGASDASNTTDKTSKDYTNRDTGSQSICLTKHIDYLIECIEMNLAQEYKVIQFDFYNDWINGLIYIPRWMRHVRRQISIPWFGKETDPETGEEKKKEIVLLPAKIKACMADTTIFDRTRYLTQQCSLEYSYTTNSGYSTLSSNQKPGCHSKTTKQKCHTSDGILKYAIFGNKGGLVNQTPTSKKQFVYYFKPCDWMGDKKITFFATDICLLGSLNDCDLFGIPQAFKSLNSSSYQMPTNLALTNLEEDGYMYSQGDSGTMCSPNNSYNENEKVKRSENSFSGAQAHNPEYTYSGNDDAVPLTEVSGIDWGYTGPGQGESKFDGTNIYQPGGHFLGISCSQAETNVKSCINLTRICEHGVGMSQRILIPKSYDNDTDTWHYVNVLPNGFISQDEIYDYDFRVMFATMNYNNLKTKRDEKTGYLKYDFVPSIPTNFDGKFTKYASKYSSLYENSASNKIKVDKINVNKSVIEEEEAKNAVLRSLESTSFDYYRFRFGITGTSSKEGDKKYFLYSNGNNVSLPVYRNSFYFYFGLKDGATALDEFNKQFFSTCKNNQDNVDNFSLSTAVYNVEGKNKSEYTIQDFIDSKIKANIKITGGIMPYDIDIYDIDGNDGNDGNDITRTVGIPTDNVYAKSLEIELKPSNLGRFRVKVTDSDGASITQNYDFTFESIFSVGLTSNNYNVPTKIVKEVNEDERKNGCDLHGGYIEWDGTIKLMGTLQSLDVNKYEVYGVKLKTDDEGVPIYVDGAYIREGRMKEGKTFDNTIAFYPDGEEPGSYAIIVKIYDKYSIPYEYLYNIFTISDAKEIDYWVGSETFKYSDFLKNKDLIKWGDSITNLITQWEYKHCFTRQDKKEGLTLQHKILNKATTTLNDIAGIPEKMETVSTETTEIKGELYSATTALALASKSSEYEGYDVSLNEIYHPTYPQVDTKKGYQYIVYDTKGQYALGKQFANSVTNLTVDVKNRLIRGYNGAAISNDVRCLIINKDTSAVVLNKFILNNGATAKAFYVDDVSIDMEELKSNIEGKPTQIYGFHMIPVYYKPFYFRTYVYTAANAILKATKTKIKGYIWNGISFKKKFGDILWNGENITNDISLTDAEVKNELTNIDRIKDISDYLKISGTDIQNGKLSFSCSESIPSTNEDMVKNYSSSLKNREINFSFTFMDDITIKKDESSGLLKISTVGSTENVKYFVINAEDKDNHGNTNALAFPCTNTNTAIWGWVNTSSWWAPTRPLPDRYYGDFITVKGLNTLADSSIDEIYTTFKGSRVENVTNKISDGSTLLLRNSNDMTNAYVVGVAEGVDESGSNLTCYCFYNKFQTLSYFGGIYNFVTPQYYPNEDKLVFKITISPGDTWRKVVSDEVTKKCVFSGKVTYSEKDASGATTTNSETFTNILLSNMKMENMTQGTELIGGEILFEYSGQHIKHDSFTIIGTTQLILSGSIKTGVDEDGNDIIMEVEEVFESDIQWTVTGQKDLNESNYIWSISATVEKKGESTLSFTVKANPELDGMKGGVKDALNCKITYIEDNVSKSTQLTILSGYTEENKEETVDFSKLAIDSFKIEIIGNTKPQMYICNGRVTYLEE